MTPLRQPRIGDTVHYVVHSGPNAGEHRPGMVVRTTEGVDLQVFASGNGKLGDKLPNVFWRYRVPHDRDGRLVGSWHWPEWLEQKPAARDFIGEEQFRAPQHD